MSGEGTGAVSGPRARSASSGLASCRTIETACPCARCRGWNPRAADRLWYRWFGRSASRPGGTAPTRWRAGDPERPVPVSRTAGSPRAVVTPHRGPLPGRGQCAGTARPRAEESRPCSPRLAPICRGQVWPRTRPETRRNRLGHRHHGRWQRCVGRVRDDGPSAENERVRRRSILGDIGDGSESLALTSAQDSPRSSSVTRTSPSTSAGGSGDASDYRQRRRLPGGSHRGRYR